jgi:hypothetical protein
MLFRSVLGSLIDVMPNANLRLRTTACDVGYSTTYESLLLMTLEIVLRTWRRKSSNFVATT